MPRAETTPSETSDDERFLRMLGDRVRTARAGAGISRRALATRTGVSERYLAQLESGTGNISVLLLRAVARALEMPLETFVAVDDEARLRRGRIALIGLRGAGKSTLGAMLAEQLDVPFVELDREIERDSGLALGAIFDIYGQAGFRRLERRALEATLETHPRFVLATGGSIVSEKGTFERLRATCVTVWLRASPEEHMARVIAQGDLRPMNDNAEAMDDLRRILESREPAYAEANAVVDTTRSAIAKSFAALREVTR